jgi:uncharacterized tellurite resistance protein B-like protein
MGFLSNLFGELSDPDATHRAIIDLLCLSIAADGEVAPEEEALAAAFLSDMLNTDDQGAADTIHDTFARIRDDGFEPTLASAASHLLLDEHREAAFLVAAWVQYADGRIHPAEDSFLQAVADALQLPEALAQEMINYVEANLDNKPV